MRVRARRIRGKRHDSPERERGAALVEAAIVLPLLIVIVFGIIEFGLAWSNNVAIRQGVREAARQGAVGNFGPTYSTGDPCHLTGASGATSNMKNLMCLAKARIGLDGSKLRVKILSANASFSGSGTFSKADSIIVCAQYPLESVTGLFSGIIGDGTLRSKTAMRIELSDMVATGGEETPPTGGSWSWCTVSSESP